MCLYCIIRNFRLHYLVHNAVSRGTLHDYLHMSVQAKKKSCIIRTHVFKYTHIRIKRIMLKTTRLATHGSVHPTSHSQQIALIRDPKSFRDVELLMSNSNVLPHLKQIC